MCKLKSSYNCNVEITVEFWSLPGNLCVEIHAVKERIYSTMNVIQLGQCVFTDLCSSVEFCQGSLGLRYITLCLSSQDMKTCFRHKTSSEHSEYLSKTKKGKL